MEYSKANAQCCFPNPLHPQSFPAQAMAPPSFQFGPENLDAWTLAPRATFPSPGKPEDKTKDPEELPGPWAAQRAQLGSDGYRKEVEWEAEKGL